MVSHKGLMTIYFKSQSIRVRHEPQKLEKQKTPNYSVFTVYPNKFPVG